MSRDGLRLGDLHLLDGDVTDPASSNTPTDRRTPEQRVRRRQTSTYPRVMEPKMRDRLGVAWDGVDG